MRFRVTVVCLAALLVGATAAAAAPSQRAYQMARNFIAKHCPVYDPNAVDALAAIYQRTMNKRLRNGRVQVAPVEREGARAEISALLDQCRRQGVSRVRALPAPRGQNTPDFQVELNGEVICVEVTAVTGRFPRHWQYRSTRGSRLGWRRPTAESVEKAIDRKLNSGQLANSDLCKKGGELVIEVTGRRGSHWGAVGKAVARKMPDINGKPEIKAMQIKQRTTHVGFSRSSANQMQANPGTSVDRRSVRAYRTLQRLGVPMANQGTVRGAPLQAPGLSPRGGGMPRALARGLGGIDFSSLELRYVSDRKGKGMRYAFRGRPGAGGDPLAGLDTAQDASDAFFVWLALSPSQFWVNLNPTEPNRIIDPMFARSDAGRVLLEADLALKKVVAPLVRPDTGPGVQFWRELEALYGDRPDLACFSVRQWIVPEPATVYADKDELYILDAPLTVKMESEFIGGFPGGGCPQRDAAFETAKEEIYRRLILPHVIRAVNTDPAFADLRRAYTSRVAAEWFRARHRRDRTAIGRIADSGDIARWPAQTPWNPVDVFNRYLDSVRNGEWSVNRTVTVGGKKYVLNTVFGGVDFSRTPRSKVTRRDFRARWPKLASRVSRSVKRPTADPARGEVWLGGRLG